MTDTNPLEEEQILAEMLRRVILALAAAGRVTLPKTPDALLRSIVEAAARIFGARAASILLVDEAGKELVFKVNWGESDHDLVGTRFPIDRGIAGYVVMTGQPIAISNVEQDARFNRDFARSTGYVPKSILATPLITGERIIGVMEVLDKLEAASFGVQDMELLGLFAHQAALAIDQVQSYERLNETILQVLKKAIRSEPGIKTDRLLEALAVLPESENQDDLYQVADLLYDFSRLGEAERKTCMKVLKAFGEYGQVQRHSIRGAGSL